MSDPKFNERATLLTETSFPRNRKSMHDFVDQIFDSFGENIHIKSVDIEIASADDSGWSSTLSMKNRYEQNKKEKEN